MLSSFHVCNRHLLPFSVHGNWSSWSQWSNCNKPCNGGNKTRKRQCDNPEPAFGGKSCEGPITESAPCNLNTCPGMHLFDGVEYNLIRGLRFKLHECSQLSKKCANERRPN